MATPKNNSVLKAFDILKLLARQPRPLSPQEIAAQTGQSLPTTHRFLLTLEEIGAVTRRQGNRYHLGMLIPDIASGAVQRDLLAERAQAAVDTLSNNIGETVYFSVFLGQRPRPLVWREAKRPLALRMGSDTDRPLHASATGKLLLASLPALKREEALAVLPLRRLTANTLTDINDLRADLRAIAKAELAEDHAESEEGLDCLAALVKGARGEAVGALTVSGPSSRLEGATRDAFRAALQSAARTISDDLRVETKVLVHKARPRGSFPHVKRAGTLAFVSGTSSRRPDDTFVGAKVGKDGVVDLDMRAQTAATLRNIGDILTSVQSGLDAVVQMEAYITRPDARHEVTDAFDEVFRGAAPKVTTIAAKALPHPHQLIMISAIATVPRQI
ncbi:MAG: IclR family transcriptional regulator C-terminal domain-containing protein [Devosia sp.]